MRRKRKDYFPRQEGDPSPLRLEVRRRVRFSEVDAMAIAWHGRYLQFFEQASEELCRRIGLSYEDYRDAGLRAPLVQAHVDYHRPVKLGEEIAIEARMIWTDAARLNTEFAIRGADGTLAASGYTVQMLTDGATGEPWLIVPPLLQTCRERWRRGEMDL